VRRVRAIHQISSSGLDVSAARRVRVGKLLSCHKDICMTRRAGARIERTYP
jgi:hypothetical protein